MSVVRLDQAAINALAKDVLPQLLPTLGDDVAKRAARDAPKDSGAGARSIRAEIVGDEIRVSWNRDHFYMFFHEVGTSKKSARPFLRPALDVKYGPYR